MTGFNQQIKSTFFILTFLGYVFLSVFGLFSVGNHMSHDGMPMANCPYMIGQHSMCAMDTFSHIRAWEDMIRTTLPSLLLCVIAIVFYFLWQKQIKVSSSVPRQKQPERDRSPYVSLFSRGILNPKIPPQLATSLIIN